MENFLVDVWRRLVDACFLVKLFLVITWVTHFQQTSWITCAGLHPDLSTETRQRQVNRILVMASKEKELPAASTLPLVSLNHVSILCRSVKDSTKFYQDVLGFALIKRPSSFDFEGAWLFNYGIGIHLLQCGSANDMVMKSGVINPKSNHFSFQCEDFELVKKKLEEARMKYVTTSVEDGGIKIDQVFFHDPDGNMIEICNCVKLPILPLSACPSFSATTGKQQ